MAQQLFLRGVEPGDCQIVRIHDVDGLQPAVFVRIVTAGGTVFTLPLHLGGEITITGGADAGRTQLHVVVDARRNVDPQDLS